jgi:hypothetical protein
MLGDALCLEVGLTVNDRYGIFFVRVVCLTRIALSKISLGFYRVLRKSQNVIFFKLVNLANKQQRNSKQEISYSRPCHVLSVLFCLAYSA